jgi:CRISPR-associated protein Cas2
MYVIAYDITDTKRLRKVAKYCESVGIRVQNSIFECDIDNIEEIKKDLNKICKDDDKIFFYKSVHYKKEEIRKKTSFWEMIF